MKINAVIGMILLSVSFSASANQELIEFCGKVVDDKVKSGVISESERYKAFADCSGQTTYEPSSTRAATPYGNDRVAAIDARTEARMREMRARAEIQREQQRMRIEMQREQQISRARTNIEVKQIEASAPALCKEQVEIKERQENIDWGPALGDVIRGRTDRVPEKIAREVEDIFKNQSRNRRVKCDDTYYMSQMPEVYHERGVYTGKVKGILNDL